MIIYPKLCENLNGLEYIKEYVKRNNGIEIQLLNIEETQKKTYEAVKRLKTEIPQLNEVTIHLPLKEEFNFEMLTYSNLDVEKERIRALIDISKEFNLRILLSLYKPTNKLPFLFIIILLYFRFSLLSVWEKNNPFKVYPLINVLSESKS